MKKLLIIMLFVSLFTSFVSAKSLIKFKQSIVDFGEANSGDEVSANFEFENAGDSVLVIKNVSTSCGCTTTKLEKLEYQPGEKGAIPVKFNTKGYSGKVTKTITVTSNDEETNHGRVQLDITGKVNLKDFAEMEMTPDQLDFGKVNLGKTYTKKVTLKNTGTLDLQIVEITHGPEVNMEFPDRIVRPSLEIPLDIVFKPMQEGPFTTFLKVRTNAYRQRLMIIRISAEIVR
ncbi:MAG TPA: DUF1573 domain-containing protein [Candidatus Deferrimicrobium sp.]|nr:DUF1573 domain-containing protein [Candidatus Kapabacteria bacterium]HLP60387.1 DUF1573 domain-containing protein [Candidatus Deferrimicrobium sp.]